MEKFVEETLRPKYPSTQINIAYTWDSSSNSIDAWHKYCQKQKRDSFVMLDENIIFANTITKKEDYASKKLPYDILEGDCPAYNEMMSILYSPEERHKIEWAIGSIITGDSKEIQKFIVIYGGPGTGKSTILNIIQKLFEGYCTVFDAKALGSSSNSFALEAFKSDPLVAIQHDGDLSKIEDNTRLNSLVSHEYMIVNEKFKATYSNRFKCFLFMGTNKPVKISDSKSGLIRRLIDVSPTGNKLSTSKYDKLTNKINFELGQIANRCKNVYLSNPNAFDHYIPKNMMSASNDFYNFMLDGYQVFKNQENISMKVAWTMYKQYCEDANVSYPYSLRNFKEEIKTYFHGYNDGINLENNKKGEEYLYRF